MDDIDLFALGLAEALQELTPSRLKVRDVEGFNRISKGRFIAKFRWDAKIVFEIEGESVVVVASAGVVESPVNGETAVSIYGTYTIYMDETFVDNLIGTIVTLLKTFDRRAANMSGTEFTSDSEWAEMSRAASAHFGS